MHLLWADPTWHPRASDPTFGGWLVALGYVMAAVLSFAAMLAYRAAPATGEPADDTRRILGILWGVVAVLLLGVVLVRQLDLGALVVQHLRSLARHHDWYENRRRYQKLFIAVVLLGGVATLAAALVALRRVRREAFPVVAVMVVIIVLGLVSSTSLHAIDRVLYRGAGWLKRSVELLASASVCLLAIRARARARC
jgi:cytochrome bd-type quinol oxidase subunit 2